MAEEIENTWRTNFIFEVSGILYGDLPSRIHKYVVASSERNAHSIVEWQIANLTIADYDRFLRLGETSKGSGVYEDLDSCLSKSQD